MKMTPIYVFYSYVVHVMTVPNINNKLYQFRVVRFYVHYILRNVLTRVVPGDAWINTYPMEALYEECPKHLWGKPKNTRWADSILYINLFIFKFVASPALYHFVLDVIYLLNLNFFNVC